MISCGHLGHIVGGSLQAQCAGRQDINNGSMIALYTCLVPSTQQVLPKCEQVLSSCLATPLGRQGKHAKAPIVFADARTPRNESWNVMQVQPFAVPLSTCSSWCFLSWLWAYLLAVIEDYGVGGTKAALDPADVGCSARCFGCLEYPTSGGHVLGVTHCPPLPVSHDLEQVQQLAALDSAGCRCNFLSGRTKNPRYTQPLHARL